MEKVQYSSLIVDLVYLKFKVQTINSYIPIKNHHTPVGCLDDISVN